MEHIPISAPHAKNISDHAKTLEDDIRAAMRTYGVRGDWLNPLRRTRNQTRGAMYCFIVLAHPEEKSLNAQLAQTAKETLEAQGHTVEITYGAFYALYQ